MKEKPIELLLSIFDHYHFLLDILVGCSLLSDIDSNRRYDDVIH